MHQIMFTLDNNSHPVWFFGTEKIVVIPLRDYLLIGVCILGISFISSLLALPIISADIYASVTEYLK